MEEIDPDTLPPLESLGPDSDYTVFLKKGVPEALRIAALRKAWMSDAFIRDFRSPAIEYGWDFTTPDYNLRATDNVEKLLDQILPRETPTQETPPEGRSAAAGGQPTDGGEAPKADAPAHGAAKPDLSLPQKQAGVPTTPARKAEPAPSLPRRKHGGALPG